jgi:hypothetical protein
LEPCINIYIPASYVESGVFEITIDGTKQILKAGDGFCNPTYGMYALEAVSIDVLTPKGLISYNKKSWMTFSNHQSICIYFI